MFRSKFYCSVYHSALKQHIYDLLSSGSTLTDHQGVCSYSSMPFWYLNCYKQECIPVGCVPPAVYCTWGSLSRGVPVHGGLCLWGSSVQGILCPGEVFVRGAPSRGLCPRGFCLGGLCPGGLCPPCGQTNICENITLPQTKMQKVRNPKIFLLF